MWTIYGLLMEENQSEIAYESWEKLMRKMNFREEKFSDFHLDVCCVLNLSQSRNT